MVESLDLEKGRDYFLEVSDQDLDRVSDLLEELNHRWMEMVEALSLPGEEEL
jgi:hypothetical protein